MDILTLFIVIPVLTMIGIVFSKKPHAGEMVAAFGMGIQLALAATLIILFLMERNAGQYC